MNSFLPYPKFACAAMLALAATILPGGARATTLYSTTFPSPPFTALQPWSGVDGWFGLNTSNLQDDVILDVGGGDLGGLLGNDNTNQESFISIFQPIAYDPVGQGEPIVTLTGRIGFQSSGNGHHDTFSIAFFNQNTQLLAEFLVEPETMLLSYSDGTQTTPIGPTLNKTGFLPYVFRIDFENNSWSLTIDGFPVFNDETFSDPMLMRDLNLGSFDFIWAPTDPTNSGDNYMVVDDLVLSANPRFSPDAAPTVKTKGKVKTKKQKVTLKGTATDDISVAAVQYRGKKGGYRSAKGTTRWNAKAKRLKPGTNRFFIRAVDSAGQSSVPSVVRVKRR